MKLTQLKAKDLNKEIEQFSIQVSKKDSVQKAQGESTLILVNKEAWFFYYENKLVPTLKLLLKQELLNKITVDMGAVRFVCKGADIMRPGITKINEDIAKDEFIVIVDETHGKPLGVGIALFDATSMQSMDAGKVIKNIHYVGDEIWKS